MDNFQSQVTVCQTCNGWGKTQDGQTCASCYGYGVTVKDGEETAAFKTPTFVDFGIRGKIKSLRILVSIGLLVVILLSVFAAVFIVSQIFS